MPLSLEETLIPFGATVLIGMLIGIEREKSKQSVKNLSALGIRTSILFCILGGLSSYLSQKYEPMIFAIAMIAMILLVLSSHFMLLWRHDRIGLTTEVTSILLFLYGALCLTGYVQLAFMLAIITTLVLSVRENLHAIIKKIQEKELFDTIKFAIIAFIILPLLPNKSFDNELLGFLPQNNLPQHFSGIEVLNPYNVWFLVVLISGISFLGYVLVKLIGEKAGIGITGMLGGLYSSTATSLTLAHKSKEISKSKTPFIAGIVLACGVSFIKIFILLRALNQELFLATLMPLGLMFIYLMSVGLFLMFRSKEKDLKGSQNFETPFKLKNALKLGAFIIGALVLAKISLAYAGVNLYYVISVAIAFFAIDDPIVISTSTIAGELMSITDAKNIIILVTVLNMVQKVAIMHFFGNRKLTKKLSIIFGGLLLVSLIGFLYF